MDEVSIKKSVTKNVSEAVEMIKFALKEEGFGTLTDINLKEKFEGKLDIEYSDYRILGHAI